MENIKIKKIHEEWCIKNGYKRSSSQALKREGGPTSVQADKLHAQNSSRFVESAQAYEGRKPKKILWIWFQSSVAKAGVSRISSTRPWIEDDP